MPWTITVSRGAGAKERDAIFSDDFQEGCELSVIDTRAWFHDGLEDRRYKTVNIVVWCMTEMAYSTKIKYNTINFITWQCWCHESMVALHSSISRWTAESSFWRNCHIMSMLQPFSQLWLIEMVSSYQTERTVKIIKIVLLYTKLKMKYSLTLTTVYLKTIANKCPSKEFIYGKLKIIGVWGFVLRWLF